MLQDRRHERWQFSPPPRTARPRRPGGRPKGTVRRCSDAALLELLQDFREYQLNCRLYLPASQVCMALARNPKYAGRLTWRSLRTMLARARLVAAAHEKPATIIDL